jgi:tetratricopeptide (TPR) repeat protein
MKNVTRPRAIVGVFIFLLLLLWPLGWGSFVYAIDLSVHVSPSIVIPTGTSASLFSVGYGTTLDADLEFFNLISPYLETGFLVEPLLNVGSNITLADVGGGLQFFTYPIPRLALRAGGGGGFSALSWGGQSGTLTYWRAKAEAGYRFTPAVSLLADAGYSSYSGTEATFFQGLSLGLTLHIGLGSITNQETGVLLKVKSQSEIFPILYSKYGKQPVATVVLQNHEQAEMRDVRVYFAAPGFTSRETECASFPLIQPGGSVELPLYAAFSDSVLAFTEATKVQAEVKVDYKVLDASERTMKTLSLRFDGRNAMKWRDPEILAAFVSPQDPSMLELSKYAAGLVRNKMKPDIDKNLQFGMGIFEALRLYGLVQGADPTSPYKKLHAEPDQTAYIQYPYQTLSFKSGDSDAIALTVAEALESIAIPAAVVPLPDDVIVAFPLKMSASQAMTTFITPGDFIYDGDQAWVPLQASRIREGFLSAWVGGAKLWRDASSAQGSAAPRLLKIEQAWKKYAPVSLADAYYKPIRPTEDQIDLAFENTLGRFVAHEITPRVQRLMSEMGGSDDGTGRQLNSLGILYARYGQYAEAKAQFEKAVAKDYPPAITNLANVAFLVHDYRTAADFFKKSLALNPDNVGALIGLARTEYEVDDFAGADERYRKLKALDPAAAAPFSYLSAHVDSPSALAISAAAADKAGASAGDGGE